MSQLQTIRSAEVNGTGITKKEALVILLDIRKKIDIMAATLIDTPCDHFDREEINTILHKFFYG